MGYRPKRKVYRLAFEDADMGGLVIRAHSTSLGGLLAALGVLVIDTDDLRPEDLARLHELFETFAAALVEWNVEDDRGQPVPATFEGVKSQDADFVLVVIRAWVDAVSGVPAPLGPPSPGGGPSAVPPLPMEPLSPSRAS